MLFWTSNWQLGRQLATGGVCGASFFVFFFYLLAKEFSTKCKLKRRLACFLFLFCSLIFIGTRVKVQSVPKHPHPTAPLSALYTLLKIVFLPFRFFLPIFFLPCVEGCALAPHEVARPFVAFAPLMHFECHELRFDWKESDISADFFCCCWFYFSAWNCGPARRLVAGGYRCHRWQLGTNL